MSAEDTACDAARIRERIAELDAERAALSRELVQLTRREPAPAPNAEAPPVTVASPAADKVALFRSLFAGRADVFPLRWENTRTGKSGYAPACANEWKPGVCEKPRIKCGEDGLATAAAQDQATAGEPAASTPVAGRLTLFANRITE